MLFFALPSSLCLAKSFLVSTRHEGQEYVCIHIPLHPHTFASPALTYTQVSLLKKLFTEEPISGAKKSDFQDPTHKFFFFFFLTSILALASASQLLPSLSFSSEQSDLLSFGPGDLRATFWPLPELVSDKPSSLICSPWWMMSSSTSHASLFAHLLHPLEHPDTRSLCTHKQLTSFICLE